MVDIMPHTCIVRKVVVVFCCGDIYKHDHHSASMKGYWPHIVASGVRVNIRGIYILRGGVMVHRIRQFIVVWSLLITIHCSDMITKILIVSIVMSHFNISVHCCGQKVLVLVWMCQIFQPISQVIFLLWMSTKVDNLVTQYLWKWTEQNLFKGKIHWTDWLKIYECEGSLNL